MFSYLVLFNFSACHVRRISIFLANKNYLALETTTYFASIFVSIIIILNLIFKITDDVLII